MGNHAAGATRTEPVVSHRGTRRYPVSLPALGIAALVGSSAVLMCTVMRSPIGPSQTGGEALADPPGRGLAPVPVATGSVETAALPDGATPPGPAASGTGSPGRLATPVPSAAPTSSTPAMPTKVQPSAATPTAAPGRAPADTVTISGFAYDGPAPADTATVTIHVTTAGPAPVRLLLHYAGGNAAGVPGDNAGLDHTFTLAGHTSYDLTDTVGALQYCYTRYFGVAASLDAGSPAAGYRYLQAPSCT